MAKPPDLSRRQISLPSALVPGLPPTSIPTGRHPAAVHDSVGTSNLATGQEAQIGSRPTLIVPQRARSGVKITNLSATIELFYGSDSTVSTSSGDLIPAGRGQAVYLETCSAVWAIVASGNTGSVSWAEIFDNG